MRVASGALHTLSAIKDLDARARAVGERRARLGDEAFVDGLVKVAFRAAHGVGADREAMLGCALWLTSPAGVLARPSLLAAAQHARQELGVTMFDVEATAAHKSMSRHGRLLDTGGPLKIVRGALLYEPPESREPVTAAELHSLFEGLEPDFAESWARIVNLNRSRLAPLPEGEEEKGTIRRVHLPTEAIMRQLEGLARRPTPEAVRALLRERPTTEGLFAQRRLVMRIAARRPTTSAIVAELLASTRWIARGDVQTAIVENPFTPLHVSLALAPLSKLRAILARRSDVHPQLHELAAMLLRDRSTPTTSLSR